MSDTEFNPEIKIYYENISYELNKLLKMAFLEMYSKNFDEYWTEKYNHSKERVQNNDKNEFFFKTINEELRKNNINKYDYNKDYEEIYRKSLEWSPEKRIDLFDLSTFFKDLCHINNVKYRFKSFYGVSNINFKDFNQNVKNCIITRNRFVHSNVKTKWLADYIKGTRGIVRHIISKHPQNDDIGKCCRSYYDTCNECAKKAGFPPIGFNEFCEKNGIDASVLNSVRECHNIRFTDGKLYGVSTDELFAYIDEFEKSSKFDSTKQQLSQTEKLLDETKEKGFLNEQRIEQIRKIIDSDSPLVTDVSPSITQNAIEKALLTQREDKANEVVENVLEQIKLPEFRYINNYRRGVMNEQELEELMLNYNFFADASAFLNKTTRKFITNVLIPYKQSHFKKTIPLFLHRAFRNEIYEIAHTEENEFITDEDINNAKNALLTINELRSKGVLCVIGRISNYEDSTSLMLDFLSENKTNRFCILTQDATVAQTVSDTGIKTLCAAKTVIDNLMIWSSSIENLKSDHKKYVYELLLKKSNTDIVNDRQNDDIDTEAPTNTSPRPVEESPEAVESLPANSQSDYKDNAIENNTSAEIKSSEPVLQNKFANNRVGEIKQVPTAGDIVYSDTKKPTILRKELGKGGEGIVYETDDSSKVAKIYYPANRSQTNYDKLKTMLGISLNNKSIIWPNEIIYNENGDYVGFVMDKTPPYCKQIGESVLKINFLNVQKTMFPNWHREDLIKVALSVANVFDVLHKNNILMGDINPANILINPNKAEEVYFVDCDSYQIGDYLCPVGTPIFTSPDYYKRCNMKPVYSKEKRTIKDEEYALATLLFEILMNGQAPFASKSTEKKNIVDDICNYRFSFKTKDSTGEDTPDGPYRMIWNNMDRSCKTKFAKVFEGNARYSANEWSRTLYFYLSQVQKNESTNELIPKKYVDKTNSFVDFNCSCCGQEANMHKDIYNKIILNHKDNPILLCNRCKGIMQNVIDEEVRCDFCGRVYNPTFGEEWRHQEMGFKYKCQRCRNQ